MSSVRVMMTMIENTDDDGDNLDYLDDGDDLDDGGDCYHYNDDT